MKINYKYLVLFILWTITYVGVIQIVPKEWENTIIVIASITAVPIGWNLVDWD